MDTSAVMDLLREGVVVVIKIAAPMLIVSMIVGVLVAIFQAVTQIHEQTLGFIFNVTVIVIILLMGGGWMLQLLKEYVYTVFDVIVG